MKNKSAGDGAHVSALMIMRLDDGIGKLFFFIACNHIARLEVKGLPKRTRSNVTDACECGIHDEIFGRIVGGKETNPNQYPWMVAIFYDDKLHCGGTLINDRYILTAGHCLKWVRGNDLVVVLGLHDKTSIEYGRNSEGVIVDVDNIVVHENFTSNYFYDTNDIGLIKLKQPVTFVSKISPICLPKNENEQFEEKLSTVIGWGKTSENGLTSQYLRRAEVTVLSNEECQNNTAIGKYVLKSMLCANNYRMDACQGDSGGPLVFESLSGKMKQIGVVSWGIGCAEPGIPGVYARVSSYSEWILSHTTDAIYCKSLD